MSLITLISGLPADVFYHAQSFLEPSEACTFLELGLEIIGNASHFPAESVKDKHWERYFCEYFTQDRAALPNNGGLFQKISHLGFHFFGWSPSFTNFQSTRLRLDDAILKGHEKAAGKILKEGVSTSDRYNALKSSIRLHKKEIVQLLVSHEGKEVSSFLMILNRAVAEKDLKSMQMLCPPTMDVDVLQEVGHTPLHAAVLYGNTSAVDMLLEVGVNIDAIDDEGLTPLQCAALGGTIEVVEKLLRAEANIEARDEQGRTALHIAAECGAVDVVEKLLGAEANIEAREEKGRTALHIAAECGAVDVVEKLLGAEANIEAREEEGRTALHIAAEYGTVDVLEKLLQAGANPNARKREGLTPLHTTVMFGTVEVLEKLLNAIGLDIEAKGDDKKTPLHIAVTCATSEVIEKLLQAGANPNTRSKRGRTPLHTAAMCGTVEVLEKLLESKVDLKARAEGGYTPLHFGVLNPNYRAVVKLLAAGADPNARTDGGRTPLHIATQYGSRVQDLEALLKAGAHVEAKIKSGKTSLYRAVLNLNLERELTREKVGDDIFSTDSAASKYREIVNTLLDSEESVEVLNEEGYTSLHLAALHGKEKAAGILFRAGANLKARTKAGYTPLSIAATVRGKDDSIARALSCFLEENRRDTCTIL